MNPSDFTVRQLTFMADLGRWVLHRFDFHVPLFSWTHFRWGLITFLELVIAAGVWLYPIEASVQEVAEVLEPVNVTPMPTPPTKMNENFYNQVVACLIPIATYYGYTMDISSGFRTYEEEDEIYERGRTKPGMIVSYVKGGMSTHNYGLAVDLVDDVYSYDIDWKRLGRIGNYCGLEHGDRGHEDLPHFQYMGGLTKEELKIGIEPPPLVMPCNLLQQRYDAGQPLTTADIRSCGIPDFNLPR